MTPPERVGARERDNLLVVEAHAVEDVAQVVGCEGAVGEAAARGALRERASERTSERSALREEREK